MSLHLSESQQTCIRQQSFGKFQVNWWNFCIDFEQKPKKFETNSFFIGGQHSDFSFVLTVRTTFFPKLRFIANLPKHPKQWQQPSHKLQNPAPKQQYRPLCLELKENSANRLWLNPLDLASLMFLLHLQMYINKWSLIWGYGTHSFPFQCALVQGGPSEEFWVLENLCLHFDRHLGCYDQGGWQRGASFGGYCMEQHTNEYIVCWTCLHLCQGSWIYQELWGNLSWGYWALEERSFVGCLQNVYSCTFQKGHFEHKVV